MDRPGLPAAGRDTSAGGGASPRGFEQASSYQTTLGWAEDLKAKANSTIDIAVDPNDLLKYETAYVAFGGLWTYLFYDAIVTTIISAASSIQI